MFRKSIMVGVAALTLGGAMATGTTPVQAQWGGYYPAYGGYGYQRPVGYYGRPSGYYGYGGPSGYYGGPSGAPYGYYGRPYYRRRNNGAAVAAGVIGGLALGAVAAQAARPAYYRTCYTQPQRVANRYGRVAYRNVRVCR